MLRGEKVLGGADTDLQAKACRVLRQVYHWQTITSKALASHSVRQEVTEKSRVNSDFNAGQIEPLISTDTAQGRI